MHTNPFDVTKADDFSNDDIARLWVDLPSGARISDILEPMSPMPLLIVGGKGSGKTHLMRHASYPLQKLRTLRNLLGPTGEGYVGIYFRCTGLDAERFAGKGQPLDKWQAVFEYYMELWIAQKALEVVADVLAAGGHEPAVYAAFLEGVTAEVDSESPIGSVKDLSAFLRQEQRKVNRAVNNCAISRSLEVEVRITRGALIFGIPRLAGSIIADFRDTRFLYLVDEFEHLLLPHQRYLQTLLRERQYPTSFRVGVRRYGVSTYETYSAGEVNKRGSEFDEIDLDARLRRSPEYPEFARHLALSRVRDAGMAVEQETATEREFLGRLFPAPAGDLLAFKETEFVRRTWEGRERPYFARLHEQLTRYRGVSREEASSTIADLRCGEYPLIEKTNVFLIYRAWNRGVTNLAGVARKLARDTAKAIDGKHDTDQLNILKHWKADLLAQLYRDCRRPVRYTGFENFVAMSSGYPRNLLVILKNAVRYASFAEAVSLSDPVPARSQDSAVRESADWFLYDAGIATPESEVIRASVERLATLMRSVRYSDLPAECSLASFSVAPSLLTANARETIIRCVSWSLLVEVPRGQKDKNTEEILLKYQLNPMIAPKWELPLSRRGALALQGPLVNAIFDTDHESSFAELLERRIAGMNVPFGRNTNRSEQQIEFSGIND